VAVTGTFQRTPAPVPYLAANWAAPNSEIKKSLGRDLSGGAQNQTVNLVEPGKLFGPALTQVDFRVAKILRFGPSRATINFDLYNLLNANTVLTYNDNFAVAPTGAVTWQQPTQILQARFFKISGQFDW